MFLLPKAKDRLKKKQLTKGIRLDAEGDASLEDLENTGAQCTGAEPSPDPEKAISSNNKVLKLIQIPIMMEIAIMLFYKK